MEETTQPRTIPKTILGVFGALLVVVSVIAIVSVANEAPTSHDGATTDLAYSPDAANPTKLFSGRRRASYTTSGRRRASYYDSRRRAASFDSRRRAASFDSRRRSTVSFDSRRRASGGYVVISSGRRRYGFIDGRRRRSVYIHSSVVAVSLRLRQCTAKREV